MSLNAVSKVKSYGGWTEVYTHDSEACSCEMRFGIYRPPQAENGKVPVLFWLSGLTCTEDNFLTKAGAQAHAAEHGILIVAPDTSPRGAGIEGEDDGWDFGTGAGFYLNATEETWAKHYNMYDYVTRELTELVKAEFPVDPERMAISGHSMGGHGALTIALKNPGAYQSVSAFAPICAPTQCPWGHKAFSGYLGEDRDTWKNYDATCLVADAESVPPILVDQGGDDCFLEEQLHPHLFEEACKARDVDLTLRMQEGYDHSYYFIASFMKDHVDFHAKHLT